MTAPYMRLKRMEEEADREWRQARTDAGEGDR
jgi:hypothetical protein